MVTSLLRTSSCPASVRESEMELAVSSPVTVRVSPLRLAMTTNKQRDSSCSNIVPPDRNVGDTIRGVHRREKQRFGGFIVGGGQIFPAGERRRKAGNPAVRWPG